MIDTKALKDKILDLAMRGKLAPQDPNDEPASELLKRIKAEKEKLINQKKIKREKNGSEIFQGDDGLHYEKFADETIKEIEVPYELPEGWAWARISQFAQAKGGKRVPKGMNLQAIKTLYPYLRVTDMKEETILLDKLLYASESIWEKIKGYTINNEDIYLTIAGTIGRAGSVPLELNNSLLTENALKIINYSPMNKSYLIKALNSNVAQNQFNNLFKQVAQPKLSIKSTLSTLIPIPPLAEQIRIVDRLSEGMELVKLIELEQHDLQELSSRLKKLVLDGAMQGTLLPQNSDDEPASILLDKIRAEKQKLFKEGKIKKKDLEEIQPTLDEDNAYYQNIPKSWSLVCLKTIVYILNGDRGKNYPSKEKLSFSGNIPFISAINLKNGLVSKESLKYLNDEQYNLLRSGKIKKDDILFCIRGSLAKNGISKFTKGAIASSLVILRSYNKRLISPLFLLAYCNSTQISSELNKYNNGTAQPNLAASDLSKFVIALPPKMQQHKILRAIYRVNNIVDFIK
ncbi:restriction endonuclease subunit S [Veillonella ratti]|uniref:restriction endonuclease subunit S n=1 Tax=Veillonella ratti TaxID=103892 RepID=UPI0034A4CA95